MWVNIAPFFFILVTTISLLEYTFLRHNLQTTFVFCEPRGSDLKNLQKHNLSLESVCTHGVMRTQLKSFTTNTKG